MEKDGLLKLKGLGEGVVVVGVERGGEEVKGFKGHGTLGEKEEREKKREKREEKERGEEEGGGGAGGKMEIREVWRANGQTMVFWDSFTDIPYVVISFLHLRVLQTTLAITLARTPRLTLS